TSTSQRHPGQSARIGPLLRRLLAHGGQARVGEDGEVLRKIRIAQLERIANDRELQFLGAAQQPADAQAGWGMDNRVELRLRAHDPVADPASSRRSSRS